MSFQRGLHTFLTVCYQYGLSHDIKYNSKNSMIIITRNRSCKNVQFPSFMLGNDTLIGAESVKYLGHIISKSMLDESDTSRQCRKLCAQSNMNISTFHMCSNDVKKTLFTTFCSPMNTALPPCTLPTYVHCPPRVHYTPMYTAPPPPCTLPTCVHCTQKFICSTINSDVKYMSRIWKYWFNSLYVHFVDG